MTKDDNVQQMNTLDHLTHYQKRAQTRVTLVKRAAENFELFFEIGYRTKQDIFTQLSIHFPKYNTIDSKKQFGLLWNFVAYREDMINDLERVIDQINSK